MRHLLMTVIFAALAAHALAAPVEKPRQVVTNPYFSRWAYGQPVGWSVLGSAECWRNQRDGDKGVAQVGGSDCALMQRVTVVPGKRYYYRALVWRSARLVIQSPSDEKPLVDLSLDGEAVGFVAPATSTLEVVFKPVGGVIFAKSFTLTPCDPKPAPSRLPVPKTPVYFASMDPEMSRALRSVNMMDTAVTPETLDAVNEMTKRGILCLARTIILHRGQPIKDDMQQRVDELVAAWIAPFVDTCEGANPGGADGIIIDEFDCYEDNDPLLEMWIKAVKEVRRLFPNKVICIWVSNSLGAPSPNGKPYSRQLKFLADDVDLTLFEVYQATCPDNKNPDSSNTGWVDGARGYGRDLQEYQDIPNYLRQVCPEILPKSMVALVVAQNWRMNFEIDSKHDFIKWLKVQMTNIPRRGRDGEAGFRGIGNWVGYRAQTSTLVAFDQYVREIFLSKKAPVKLTDADALQAVENASFEQTSTTAWLFSTGASLAKYDGTSIPNLHDDKVEHFSQFLKLTRHSGTGGAAQRVDVEPGHCYKLAVYALPLTKHAGVQLRVRDGNRVLAKRSVSLHGPANLWLRPAVTFAVPKGVNKVDIEITNDGSELGEETAIDFVTLSPMEGLNRPPEIVSIEPVRAKDLPRQVRLKGRNLLPNSVVIIDEVPDCRVSYVAPDELLVTIPVVPPGTYDMKLEKSDWMGDPQPVVLGGGLVVTP